MKQLETYKIIKEIRLEKNLSQKELAERVNLSQQAIALIENGKRKIDINLFIKLMGAMEINKTEFHEIISKTFNLTEEQCPDFDNKERHHLLIHHYDTLDRVGRDSLLEILASLKTLNDKGCKEASKRVEELTFIEKYKK